MTMDSGPPNVPIPAERTVEQGPAIAGSAGLPADLKDILYLTGGEVVEWEVFLTTQVEGFLDALYETDRDSHKLVNQAILILERNGPAEGRPLVDTLAGSKIPNLKELRPPSGGHTEIRILFAFDPWRSAVLLVAGDKAGRWSIWYREAITQAEHRYEAYLMERGKEMNE
jgi:hypothetical protein